MNAVHQQKLMLLLNLHGSILLLLLLLHARPVASGNAIGATCTTSTCNSTILSQLTFPFTASSCGNSSGSIFFNCSNKYLSWPHFFLVDKKPPNVTAFFNPPYKPSTSSSADIYQAAGYGHVNLTWNDMLTRNQDRCVDLVPIEKMSDYLPVSINLTSFENSSFQFSPLNSFLLFHCSGSPSNLFQGNTRDCRSYAKACSSKITENRKCLQYKPKNDKEFALQDHAKGLGCTHFMFFLSNTSSPLNASKLIHPGTIQLNWSTTDTGLLASEYKKCARCLNTNGTCHSVDNLGFQCLCSNNHTSDTDCNDRGRGCRGFSCRGRKILIIIGVVIYLLGTGLLFCLWRRRHVPIDTNVPPSSSHSNALWKKRPSFLSRKYGLNSAEEFSYQDLLQATGSFAESRMLGDGGFGAVYMGVLPDGRKVAVKKLYHDNHRRMEHFANEIKILSNLDHPNLVKLYGFCLEGESELLLVFEYAPHGTVSDRLHDAAKAELSWECGLNIACETANALSYLHNASTPVYHRDVKSTNILLGEGYHAKLADFGLSKPNPLMVSHVSTAPQGTPGYLDPHYHQCYQLTDKSDVYSLGVVLMELVSGKLAVDMSRSKGEINLSTLAVMKIKCGSWEELVDSRLEMRKNSATERMVKGIIELAFECLQAEKDERPHSCAVAESLANIRREYVRGREEEKEVLHNTRASSVATYKDIHYTEMSCKSHVLLDDKNESPGHEHSSANSVFFSSGSSYALSSASSN